MIKRYTLQAMAELWTRRETKFEYWLRVELAVLQARVVLGTLSKEAYKAISTHAKINLERIDVYDKELRHDLIAFVRDVQDSLVEANVGQYKEEFHKGITSYDTEDPALILLLRESVSRILIELQNLCDVTMGQAQKHKMSIMMGTTHGQDAEPTTFGAELLMFYFACLRSVQRLQYVLENELSDGKISGAVGTYAGLNPRLEEVVLRILGLNRAKAESQILQRDRHANLVATLAVAAGTMEQMARTFWEMMRSRNRELEEPRSKNQKGSSAMAHKKNPITIEQMLGMSRLVRGNALAMMESIATPELRDISQSCVERVALVDALVTVHYMVVKLAGVVKDMTVFTNNMRYHVDISSHGVWAGQQVRIALMGAGIEYQPAYDYVQALSFEAVSKGDHVRNLFYTYSISETDRRTAKDILGEQLLASYFDAEAYVRPGIEYIFAQINESAIHHEDK